jgi:surface protein
MTLHVTKGTPPNEVQYTVSIPYASFGENSVAITNQQLTNDFSNKPPGTTYSYHITTNYTPGSFPTGDVITTPTVSNQSVKATPSLYATPLEYNPTTQDGYVSQCSSTSSNASINYTIDDANVATIEPVTGKIIPIGTGITEMVYSQSSNSEYEQATTRSTVIVSMIRSTTASVKVVPLIRLSNNTTIMYTGNPSNIPNNLPLFILADIRITGTPELFAIVNDSSFLQISNYARNQQEAIQFFTPPGQLEPVPFRNIVTTHVTNMGGMFRGATAFNRDISSWDTSRVMNMSFMFQNATSFNQNISNWNTSNVRVMIGMFLGAVNFNNGMPPNPNWSNRLTWNVSNVIPSGFDFMFNGASSFNTNISDWDVRSPAIAFRRNSPLIDGFTPPAILNATGQGR